MIVPALAVVLSLVAPAAPRKTVVLVNTSAGVPYGWRVELRTAAESAELKGVAFVPPPAVSIEDAALALGCPSFNDPCAGQLAGMTGATHAIVIDAAAAGDGVELVVRTVADDGKVTDKVRKLRVEGMEASHLETAKTLVRAALADKPIALVWIETETPGVSIDVDGVRVGRTPLTQPLQLEPGTRKLLLSQEGRAPLSVALQLKPYQLHRDTYVLGSLRPDPALKPTVGEPKPTPPPSEEPPHGAAPSGTAPIVGYVVAGVGGVVALIGLGLTTAWVSGYFDASNDIAKDRSNPTLSRCLGLCSDDSGIGLGISGPARQAYIDGSFSAWIGASIATLGVGGLLTATGLFLALAPPPDEASAP